ncbi:MAG: tRNA (cytidine(34)-2'-O)-methyltransferase [Desulfurivibrionaceae bacterium]|nr:tRNA (cytidine(34)-2'-O)-methyltransferase [Desulfobulbales bacterium]MDT8335761.1 tRNA (cytidine(34)-2'-O)-methyltransferase [Desulfurivibrionaceae bacterium]
MAPQKVGKPFNIVLVEPEIPPNTGSVARLCGATDTILHLIKPLGFSTDDSRLKRAGLDYWKFVEIVYWESFEEFLAGAEIRTLHFLSKKAAKPYTESTFKAGDFLIFGKETKGLPNYILDSLPDRCFNIPMPNPNIRSLNLAMCCGIVLYEAIRQRQSG